jgi:hypothetical protein
MLLILALASPAWAAKADPKCVTNSLSATIGRDIQDPGTFRDVNNFERIYKARKKAGEGEPTITLSNFETARNYVLSFPAFKKYGFNTGDSTQWHRVYSRLERSSFYEKFVGWDEKLSNGNYARYRYDFEPDQIDPASKKAIRIGRGAHWNIEFSIMTANGIRENFKLAVQFLCGAGHKCTETEALTYLKAMNR